MNCMCQLPLLLYFWHLELRLHQVVPLELLHSSTQGSAQRQKGGYRRLAEYMVAVLHVTEAVCLFKLFTVPQDRTEW